MDVASGLAVLDRLDEPGVPFWGDGGWGIDALVGEQTRTHADLDLVVAQPAVAAARSALGALGYRHDPTAQPGLPARAVLVDGEGRQVDLHSVVLDAEGNGWQPLGDDDRHDLRLLARHFGLSLPPGL